MTRRRDEVRAALQPRLRETFDRLIEEWSGCAQGDAQPYEALAGLLERGWKKQRGDRKPICKDWCEWAAEPDLHPPFHYWRWNDAERHRSDPRLGQRIYISACLLWTAMHDRLVGKRLADKYPNWSAICSYYSMVHALRLVWFVLYGSYPTRHAPLGEAMAGAQSIIADWSHGDLRRGGARLSADALKGALRDGLGDADLANRVATIGRVFCHAVELRKDSNYESLILAHQYRHGTPGDEPDGFVSVEREFPHVYDAMSRAQSVVLDFTSRVVRAAFADERAWFCPREVYEGQQLLALFRWHVQWKIAFVAERWEEAPPDLAEWWTALPGLDALPSRETFSWNPPLPGLARPTEFEMFNLKSGIMHEFQEKIGRLEEALRGAGNEPMGRDE